MLDLLKMLKKKFGASTVIIMPHESEEKEDKTPKMMRMMMKNMVKNTEDIKNKMSNSTASG